MDPDLDLRSSDVRERIDELLANARYAEVLEIADAAILQVLHDGLSVDDFVRLTLRGAAFESLIRVDRRAVMRFHHLHGPIALRWEVLRRSGRTSEAQQMRLLCIRHFPERASVWATAGNQALDEQSYAEAEACFERCLRCNSQWTAGLAGLAIVYETRKDWPRALVYRKQVVDNEAALEKNDPPSLQRVMRYAAALARVDRWHEAGALMRQCIERGVVERVPAERPVLARAFSRELYAPAIVVGLPIPDAEVTPDIACARREAELLGAAARAILASTELAPSVRLTWLGVCAWLAGDDPGAYAFLDEAEVDAPDDLTIHCFLSWAAEAVGADDLGHIERFALERARALRVDATRNAASDMDVCSAAIILMRARERDAALELLRSANPPPDALAAICVAAFGLAPSEQLPSLPARHESVLARVQRLAVFRAAHRAVGRSALEVALSSTAALEPPQVTSDL